jgi:flagellar motor switch protein FliG
MNVNDARLAAYQKAAGQPDAGFVKAVSVTTESVYRRVAKFLLLIGIDEAAKVLSRLTGPQRDKIIPEIAAIRFVAPDEASQILEEFQSLLQKSRESGGVETARVILEQAFGVEKAEEVLDKAAPFRDGKPFEYLDDVDGERLYLLLRDESLAVQCLAMTRVSPALAASALGFFDPGAQKEIIKRMAKVTPVAVEVVRRVDQELHEKLLAMGKDAAGERMDGRGTLVEILLHMGHRDSEDILNALYDSDPALSVELRNRLFTVADVPGVTDEIIQKELFSMSDKDISKLLADKPEEFREKILANVSKGRGDRILEEESIGKPFRRADCDAITEIFMTNIRQEWDGGRII